MSDFALSLNDISNSDWTSSHPIVRTQNKWLPTGKPLTTTRSAVGLQTAANPSVLSVSEILQLGTMFNNPADALQKMEDVITHLISGFSTVADLGNSAADALSTGISDLVPDDLKSVVSFGESLARQALSSIFGGNSGPANQTATQDLGNKLVNNTKMVHFQDGPIGANTKNALRNGIFSYNIANTLNILTSRFGLWLGLGVAGSGDTSLHSDGHAIDIVQIFDNKTNKSSVIGTADSTILMAILSMLNTMPWIHQSGQIISPIDPGFGPAFYTNAQHQGPQACLHIGCSDSGTNPILISYDSTQSATSGTSSSSGAGGGSSPGIVGTGTSATGGALVSGIIWPFATKSTSQYQRVDQGWDIQSTPGCPVYAIASGTIHQFAADPGGFGNDYPTQQLDSPITINGTTYGWIYYGHTHILQSVLGQHVQTGDQIAVTNTYNPQNGSAAPTGWLEIGFARPGTDAPTDSAPSPEAVATQAGQNMKALLVNAPTAQQAAASTPGSGGLTPS